jgi:hypothetical protein
MTHVLILSRVSDISTQGLLMLRLGAERCLESRCHAGEPNLRTQPVETGLVRGQHLPRLHEGP